MKRVVVLAVAASIAAVSSAFAQASGVPSFNAPYRAFQDHEAGFMVSFPGLDNTALEGVFRFGQGKFDVGLRGGVWFLGGPVNDEIFLLGVEGRQRIITHSDDFPADGALIVGVGAQVGAFDNFIPSVGLSLGRRLDLEDSDVSIIPYIQPNLWWFIGDSDQIQFSLGLGADLRLTPRFDLRVSVGVGDVDGISIGGVWVR
ncbi:MAG: hypothetical protein O7I93_14960 [Gemmatimonadetes bacterium]|nr:hypothetical protein [Gemmatimonadota bacterium]